MYQTTQNLSAINPVEFYNLLEQRPLQEFKTMDAIPSDEIVRHTSDLNRYIWQDPDQGLVVLVRRKESCVLSRPSMNDDLFDSFQTKDIINRAAAYLFS